MLSTREELRNQVQEVTIWLSITSVATGMLLSITVPAMPVGMWFVLGSIALLAGGWSLSWLLPYRWQNRIVVCPYCGNLGRLQDGEKGFICSKCNGKVRIKEVKGRPGQALQALVLLPGITLGDDEKQEDTRYAKKLG